MKITSSLHQVFFAALVLLFGAGATMAQVPQLLNYQGRIAVNGTNFTGTGQFKFALVDGGTNLTRTATGTATVIYGFLVAVTVTEGGAGYSIPPMVSAIGGGGSGASFTAQISSGVVTNVIVNSAGSGYTGSPTISFSAPAANIVAQTFWSNDGTSSSGGQPTTSVPLPVTKGLYSVLLGDTTLSNMTALPASVFANPGVWLRVWFSDGTTGFQQLTPDQRLAAVGYAIMAGTVPDGSITAGKIAPGAVGSSQLASNLTIPGTLTVSNLVINGSAFLNNSSSYQIPGGTNIQTYGGGNYFITNLSSNIILPPNANVGDTIHLYFPNANGLFSYNLLQNPGQRIVKWINNLSFGPPVVSSADGNRLLASAGLGLYLSTNFAASWTLQTLLEPWPTPAYYSSFQISGDGSHIFAVAYFQTDQQGDGYPGIIVSGDYGQSWNLNTNVLIEQYYNYNSYGNFISSIACSTNGVKAVAVGGYYGSIITSTDAGSNWTLQTSAPTNTFWTSVASSADGTKLVAVAQWWNDNTGGIYTSGNSGQTWTLQTSAPKYSYVNWCSVASSTDGTKLVACAGNGGIYTSIDSGSTWMRQTNGFSIYGSYYVASSADGSKLVAAAGDNTIYTSVNSGLTWMLQTNGVPDDLLDSVSSSADGLKLTACYSDQLYTSVDLGNTWNPCSIVTPPSLALVAVTSLGTSGGIISTYYQLILVYLGNGMFTIEGGSYIYGY